MKDFYTIKDNVTGEEHKTDYSHAFNGAVWQIFFRGEVIAVTFTEMHALRITGLLVLGEFAGIQVDATHNQN